VPWFNNMDVVQLSETSGFRCRRSGATAGFAESGGGAPPTVKGFTVIAIFEVAMHVVPSWCRGPQLDAEATPGSAQWHDLLLRRACPLGVDVNGARTGSVSGGAFWVPARPQVASSVKEIQRCLFVRVPTCVPLERISERLGGSVNSEEWRRLRESSSRRMRRMTHA
jgi:hypothetical protein